MAISRCRTSEYENFTIVSPSHTEGHTITECHSILRDEASVYFNVTAVHV